MRVSLLYVFTLLAVTIESAFISVGKNVFTSPVQTHFLEPLTLIVRNMTELLDPNSLNLWDKFVKSSESGPKPQYDFSGSRDTTCVLQLRGSGGVSFFASNQDKFAKWIYNSSSELFEESISIYADGLIQVTTNNQSSINLTVTHWIPFYRRDSIQGLPWSPFHGVLRDISYYCLFCQGQEMFCLKDIPTVKNRIFKFNSGSEADPVPKIPQNGLLNFTMDLSRTTPNIQAIFNSSLPKSTLLNSASINNFRIGITCNYVVGHAIYGLSGFSYKSLDMSSYFPAYRRSEKTLDELISLVNGMVPGFGLLSVLCEDANCYVNNSTKTISMSINLHNLLNRSEHLIQTNPDNLKLPLMASTTVNSKLLHYNHSSGLEYLFRPLDFGDNDQTCFLYVLPSFSSGSLAMLSTTIIGFTSHNFTLTRLFDHSSDEVYIQALKSIVWYLTIFCGVAFVAGLAHFYMIIRKKKDLSKAYFTKQNVALLIVGCALNIYTITSDLQFLSVTVTRIFQDQSVGFSSRFKMFKFVFVQNQWYREYFGDEYTFLLYGFISFWLIFSRELLRFILISISLINKRLRKPYTFKYFTSAGSFTLFAVLSKSYRRLAIRSSMEPNAFPIIWDFLLQNSVMIGFTLLSIWLSGNIDFREPSLQQSLAGTLIGLLKTIYVVTRECGVGIHREISRLNKEIQKETKKMTDQRERSKDNLNKKEPEKVMDTLKVETNLVTPTPIRKPSELTTDMNYAELKSATPTERKDGVEQIKSLNEFVTTVPLDKKNKDAGKDLQIQTKLPGATSPSIDELQSENELLRNALRVLTVRKQTPNANHSIPLDAVFDLPIGGDNISCAGSESILTPSNIEITTLDQLADHLNIPSLKSVTGVDLEEFLVLNFQDIEPVCGITLTTKEYIKIKKFRVKDL